MVHCKSWSTYWYSSIRRGVLSNHAWPDVCTMFLSFGSCVNHTHRRQRLTFGGDGLWVFESIIYITVLRTLTAATRIIFIVISNSLVTWTTCELCSEHGNCDGKNKKERPKFFKSVCVTIVLRSLLVYRDLNHNMNRCTSEDKFRRSYCIVLYCIATSKSKPLLQIRKFGRSLWTTLYILDFTLESCWKMSLPPKMDSKARHILHRSINSVVLCYSKGYYVLVFFICPVAWYAICEG